MNITQSFIPVGTAARPGTKLSGMRGVTIHNTGNPAAGANAERHMLYMTKNGGQNALASYHYVVDENKIYQLVPEDEVTWHAGDGATGPGNSQTISIEICDNVDGDILKATESAVLLTADILKRHGLTAEKNLFQHATWMNKDCPHELRSGRPYSWAVFAEKVKQAMNPVNVKTPTQSAGKTEPGNAAAKEPIKAGAERSVYRLYNPNSGDHLYTTNVAEANLCQNGGWTYEGIAWVYPKEGLGVYRLLSPSGAHLFTEDKVEIGALEKAGWKNEGLVWRSGGSKSIYRLYNPNSGAHLLTADRKEHDALVKAGWYCESTEMKYE